MKQEVEDVKLGAKSLQPATPVKVGRKGVHDLHIKVPDRIACTR